MNSSSPLLRGIQVISGLHIISCQSKGLFFNFLQLKSPKLLVKFNPPFTLPLMISPPKAQIRFLSVSFSGLWSLDKGTQCPFRQRTARESPALAVKILVAVIKTTHAVHPVPRETTLSLQLEASYFFLIIFNYSYPYLLSIIQSIRLKVQTKASEYFYYLQNLVFFSWVTNIFQTNLDTQSPLLIYSYRHVRQTLQIKNFHSRYPILQQQHLTSIDATLHKYKYTLHLAFCESQLQFLILSSRFYLLSYWLCQIRPHSL